MPEVESVQQFAAADEQRARADELRRRQLIYQLQRRVAAQRQQQIAAAGGNAERIGWGMFLFQLVLSLIADFAEIVTGGTLGWFVGLFVDVILIAISSYSRGGKKQFKKILTAVVGEKVPFVNVLPLRTIMVVWAFIASNPSVQKNLGAALKVAGSVPSPIAAQAKVASRVYETAQRAERIAQYRRQAMAQKYEEQQTSRNQPS